MLVDDIFNEISRLDSFIASYQGLAATKRYGDSTVTYYSQSIKNMLEGIRTNLRNVDKIETKAKVEDILKSRMDKVSLIEMTLRDKEHLSSLTKVPSYQDENEEVEHSDLSLVEKGNKFLKLSSNSVTRMKKKIVETEKLGDEALSKIHVQEEQLEKIRAGLGDVDYNLNRAKITIRAIARDTATDFCVRILCGILTVAVIILIIIIIITSTRRK
ncbi:hypothetical protein ACR3K2_36350 [Cryptosporidium serpentis]